MLFCTTNLDNLRYNAKTLAIRYNTPMIAVLKHDAHSCGLLRCAAALQGHVLAFAVSEPHEALALIDSKIPPGDIMVLDPVNISELSGEAIKTVLPVDCEDIISAFENIYITERVRVQIRVDLCQSGIGLVPDKFTSVLERIVKSDKLKLCGVFAHAPTLYRHEDVREIYTVFSKLCSEAKALVPNLVCHIATSASAAYEILHFDAVRIGTALYGLPSRSGQDVSYLKPVLSLHSNLSRVFDSTDSLSFYDCCENTENITKAGIVSAGYGELPSLLSKKNLRLIVRDTLVPTLGSPSMGHIIADLTKVPEAKAGDEAIFVGTQQKRAITAESFANSCNITACRCDGALFSTADARRIYIDNGNCIIE